MYIYRCLVSYKNINIQSTVSLLSVPLTDKEKVFFRLVYGRPTLVEYILSLYSSLALSILCLSYRVV